ncbi:MAG: hypothetical protein J6M31_04615 [Bacteroidales bacterium]|nr:hypothetical protein [Bacteroidales bacterium]
MMGQSEFYLVSTDHLETTLWFRDEDDFKQGMNAVALIASVAHVCVVAFILMSNHVHFLLQCSKGKAALFIESYKSQYSRYYSKKYGVKELLRRNGVDIREIPLENESLERAIAYVQANPVAANICLSASDYPWGSGSCFFRPSPLMGTPLESLSKRKQYSLLHSRQSVSERLIIGAEGYIDPRSYVNIHLVESVFRTPKRMNFFLLNSSKAKRRLENDSDIPAFRDQVVSSALGDLCTTLFGTPSFNTLSEQGQAEILKQVKYRFSSNVHQLSRVCGKDYEEVCHLLETV